MEEIKDYPPYLDYPKPRKQKTNADRIRAMSDAELADWLAMGAVTGACIKLGIAPAKKCIGICTKCIEEWLKQPERE